MIRRYKWSLALGILLLCNNWLLAPLLNPHMSTVVSLISEVSAASQPYHWVFQLGDITAGVLILCSVPMVLCGLRRRHYRQPLLLGLTIISIGLDSIVDALLPISCAPSIDTHCQLAATHSLITYAHMIESTAAGVLIVAAPLIWWAMARKQQLRVAHASLYFIGLQIVVGLLVLIAQGAHWSIVGAAQRAYEVGIGLWLSSLIVWLPVERQVQQVQAEQATLDLRQA